MIRFVLLTLVLFFTAPFMAKLKSGNYRGVLLLNTEKAIELPFNFSITSTKKQTLIIQNGDERITINELKKKVIACFLKCPFSMPSLNFVF